MREFRKRNLNFLLMLLTILLTSLYLSSIIKKPLIDFNNSSVEDRPKSSGSTPVWEYVDTDNVFSVAISSDSNYIVAGTLNNRVRLFHKSSSTPIWSFTAGDEILSVDISSNGKYCVAGGYDRSVRLFENTSSSPLWSFGAMFGSWISSVAISSDGNYIVAGSAASYNTIFLFHKSSSTPLWTRDIGDWVKSVAISSDGSYIVVGSRDNKVRLFHRSSSTPLWSYTTTSQVLHVDISASGDYIVAGTEGWGTVHFFNRSSSTPLWSFQTGRDISSVAISSDGEYVVSGGIDDTIRFFHRTSSTQLWTYKAYWDINSVAISSDGKYITAGTYSPDRKVYLFEKSSNIPLWNYSAYDRVCSVDLSSDGKYIVAGSFDNTLRLFYESYEPRSFTLTSNAENPDTDGMFDLIWTGSRLSNNYSVYVYNNYITEINSSLTLLIDGLTSLSHPISVKSNGTYYYIVAAFNQNGNITSNCISVETKLFPPNDFVLSTDADTPDLNGIFNLIWTDSMYANNYSVYVYDNYITEINTSITLLVNQTASSPYLISGLTNGTYYYVIVAFNPFGNTTSNCISIEVKLFPPGSFTLSSDADTPDTDGSFNLIWTDSAGADNYSVYVHDGYITEINGSLTLLVNQTASSPYLISGLTNGTYYYVIVAFNPFGNTTSNCISIEVKLFPPGSFTLSSDADTPDTDGSFNLIWTDSAGVDNYSVFVYNNYITEINDSLTLLANQTANSPYPIIENSGIYYYIVVAYNGTGFTLSNCISVDIRVPPGSFSLSTDADTPDTDGLFNLIWTDSMYADNYSIYFYDKYITEINSSLTILADQTASSPHPITETSGIYYYVVVAYNEYDMIMSNCVKIEVHLPSDQSNVIPGYDIFLLIGTISIVLLILKRKQKQ